MRNKTGAGLAALVTAAALSLTNACVIKQPSLAQIPNYSCCVDMPEFNFVEGRTTFDEVKSGLRHAGITNITGGLVLAVTENNVSGAMIGDCTPLYFFETGILVGSIELDNYVISPRIHGARILGETDPDKALFIIYSDTLSFGNKRGLIAVTYPDINVKHISLEALALKHGGFNDVLLVGMHIGPKAKTEMQKDGVVSPDFIAFTARDNNGMPWETAYKLHWNPKKREPYFSEMNLSENRSFRKCSSYCNQLYTHEFPANNLKGLKF